MVRRLGASQTGDCDRMLQCLQELQPGDCHEINPFYGYQHASTGGERKASQTDGQSAWVDPQRRQCAPGGGRLAPVRIGFIDFRDSPVGRQVYIQGSTLAVWEVMLFVHSYKQSASAVARHLKWPEVKVQAAVNYAKAFPEEINVAMAENEATNFETLKRMLPQAVEFVPKKAAKN
jgi:hypothetical protein